MRQIAIRFEPDTIEQINDLAANRSAFVRQAVRQEIARRSSERQEGAA